MTSEKQIQANRLNAQKSTGPKTPEGKLRVSFNGLKHGLLATGVRAKFENEAQYENWRNDFLAELAPIGVTEELLAERIVQSAWRMTRAARYEKSFVDDSHLRTAEQRPLTPGDIEGNIETCFRSGMYDRLFRYEMRSERAFYKAHEKLMTLQQQRKAAQDANAHANESSHSTIAADATANANASASEASQANWPDEAACAFENANARASQANWADGNGWTLEDANARASEASQADRPVKKNDQTNPFSPPSRPPIPLIPIQSLATENDKANPISHSSLPPIIHSSDRPIHPDDIIAILEEAERQAFFSQPLPSDVWQAGGTKALYADKP
jgi:hypothetical protein